jgi:hypothetical protein
MTCAGLQSTVLESSGQGDHVGDLGSKRYKDWYKGCKHWTVEASLTLAGFLECACITLGEVEKKEEEEALDLVSQSNRTYCR